jgi:hypothetical protein
MTARKPKSAAKRPVGRPAHKVTDETRLKVTELLSAKMSEDEIASVLRICSYTLRKRYAQELKYGFADRRAEVVSLLYGAARKGNASAIKHLDAMTAVNGAEAAFDRAVESAPKAARLGKKEQALLDAETAGAGSEWAEDLGPIPTGDTAH